MNVINGEVGFIAHDDGSGRIRRFAVEIAHGAGEAQEALRLRYRIFHGARVITGAPATDIDHDHFDQFCDHLLIRDLHTGDVAGTYRLLGQEAARRAGGFYSEGEFDLGAIHLPGGRVLEVGRACVDPRYRSGAVISALWAGLFNYIAAHDYDYVIGCGSIPLAPGHQLAAAICRLLLDAHLSPVAFRVHPRRRYPADGFDLDPVVREQALTALPPLIKGYLRLGAWVCGEPAWDTEFNVADLLVLLPMERLNARYASHYRRGVREWLPVRADSTTC